MSSVRDRIRNLQQQPPATIPASPSLFNQTSLVSQHPQSNSNTPKVNHVVAARRTASDNEDGRVATSRKADVVTDQNSTTDQDSANAETLVNNARKMFEQRKYESNVVVGEEIGHKSSIRFRAAAFEQIDPTPSTDNKRKIPGSKSLSNTPNNDHGLKSRAAVFEQQQQIPAPTTPSSLPPPSPSPSQLPSPSPQLSSFKSSSSDSSKININNSNDNRNVNNELNKQLVEVKSLNNTLVKSLIDLTENYRRLERSRDSLQKRISELEGAAK